MSCPDCHEAAKLAYSDATTPGFFSPLCDRHEWPYVWIGQSRLPERRGQYCKVTQKSLGGQAPARIQFKDGATLEAPMSFLRKRFDA